MVMGFTGPAPLPVLILSDLGVRGLLKPLLAAVVTATGLGIGESAKGLSLTIGPMSRHGTDTIPWTLDNQQTRRQLETGAGPIMSHRPV